MAFPVANNTSTPPVYPAGFGTGNTFQAAGFIPQIWSGKLIEKFYASTVLAAISNTDYEGEIKSQGDTVKIRTKPTITIKDYQADGRLDLERPVGSEVDLLINKAKYFSVICDDVMDVQMDVDLMAAWSDDAGEQFKITIDSDVLLGLLNGATATTNRGLTAGKISANMNLGATGTPVTVVPTGATGGQVNIVDMILRLGQTLDEQNIPETGRWLVLPAWAATQVKSSPLTQAYLSGDSVSMLRNGRLGMVDRFTLYISNLLPHGTSAGLAASEWVFYAGHAHGLTFASQITKVETLRAEQTFGNILRGLQVYGYQVLDGTALAQAIVVSP